MKLKAHLKERGMNPDLYKMSFSYYDNSVTFYLFNLSGRITGYQIYRPLITYKKTNHPKEARYFTYLPRETDGVFGLELLDKLKKDLYIVEGVFKASILHRLGFNAIAVLTATPKRLKPWFRIMKQQYNLIAIGDADDAGKKLVNTVGNGFQSPKDLDEMLDVDIKELLNHSH